MAFPRRPLLTMLVSLYADEVMGNSDRSSSLSACFPYNLGAHRGCAIVCALFWILSLSRCVCVCVGPRHQSCLEVFTLCCISTGRPVRGDPRAWLRFGSRFTVFFALERPVIRSIAYKHDDAFQTPSTYCMMHLSYPYFA